MEMRGESFVVAVKCFCQMLFYLRDFVSLVPVVLNALAMRAACHCAVAISLLNQAEHQP